MVVLIDTNVILDVFQKREPFYKSSNKILNYCASGEIKGYIAIHSISNIFFILRKQLSTDERRKILLMLLDFLEIANANHKAVKRALLRNDFNDFEDCLQDECTKQVFADYIITRNISDFLTSEIPAISPSDFLEEWKNVQ